MEASRMGSYPDSDQSFQRLQQAGWTVGDIAVHGESGLVWIVSGFNGENLIEARGTSRDEAWSNALPAS
jgi:hypothetical protein